MHVDSMGTGVSGSKATIECIKLDILNLYRHIGGNLRCEFPGPSFERGMGWYLSELRFMLFSPSTVSEKFVYLYDFS